MTLDTIPMKTLIILLNDESRVSELLKLPGKEAQKVWMAIKQEYIEKNPSAREQKIFRPHNKAVVSSLEENKLKALLFIENIADDSKEFFDAAKVKYYENKEERIKHLQKLINKATTKAQIEGANFQKLYKTLEEEPEEEREAMTIERMNEALASLQINGINVGNFDKVTYGEYKAYTSQLTKKARNNGKRNA